MGLSLELACPRAGGSLGVSTQQPKQKESGVCVPVVLIPDRSCEHVKIPPRVLSQNLRGDSCGEWLWACSPVTAVCVGGGGCKEAAEGPDSTQESGGGRDSTLGLHKSDSAGSWSQQLRPWPFQSSVGTGYVSIRVARTPQQRLGCRREPQVVRGWV